MIRSSGSARHPKSEAGSVSTDMRTTANPSKTLRCRYALKVNAMSSRCFLKPGHNGPHDAKGMKRYPYQRIRWFVGDDREFVTDRDTEYAWWTKKEIS